MIPRCEFELQRCSSDVQHTCQRRYQSINTWHVLQEILIGCAYLGIFNVHVNSLLALMSPLLMKPSSTPAKQDWHSSSLAYAAIPNPQDDFDSITSEAKSTAETGTDFYDLGRTSRRWALAGLMFSAIFSISCIITGTVILATYGGSGMVEYPLPSALQLEMIPLVLNLIITVCTESTGFAHGISLRSALAAESRLRFNGNLRLLTAARGWRSPNGIILNGAMAILLVLSYALSSFVIFTMYAFYIVGLPLFLLGIALLLQVVIAFLGIRAVKILTWSSSPFDVTAALVHHIQLTPVPLRCMLGVSDVDVHGGPTKPFEVQPSAWDAHPSIRKVIMSLWGLVVTCAVWAALVILMYKIFQNAPGSGFHWSFFPISYFGSISWILPLSGGVTVQWWILSFTTVVLVQGPLTLGLHCSELIASVIRDERYWRRATRTKGLRMKTTPLNSFFTDPLSLVLFVAKPTLRESFALLFIHCLSDDLDWMFGLAFNFYEYIPDADTMKVSMSMSSVQVRI